MAIDTSGSTPYIFGTMRYSGSTWETDVSLQNFYYWRLDMNCQVYTHQSIITTESIFPCTQASALKIMNIDFLQYKVTAIREQLDDNGDMHIVFWSTENNGSI